jgi:hypothetical protein
MAHGGEIGPDRPTLEDGAGRRKGLLQGCRSSGERHPCDMTNLNRRLTTVATGQLGAFSREQAHAVGATDEQLRSRVMSGFLLQSGPNVFRLPGSSTDPLAELSALVIDVGGDVVVSRHTAAALHGFSGYALKPPFDLSVGRDRYVTRIGHRIHQVGDLDLIDRAVVGKLPVTRGARTLIDLARTESETQLRIALDDGLRDGRFSEDSLHRRIVALRRSGRYGIPALLRAIEGAEAVSGAHSWLEREFLRLIAAAGLPRPDPQVVLTRASDRLVRVDFRFPGTPVVVEVLGYTWHASKDNLSRDAARLNALLDIGMRPYQYTYEMIVETPDHVVENVRRALLL